MKTLTSAFAGQHVLILGQGTALFAAAAAQAGARKVTLIESSRMLYLMTRDMLEDDADQVLLRSVNLCCQGLEHCKVEGMSAPFLQASRLPSSNLDLNLSLPISIRQEH